MWADLHRHVSQLTLMRDKLAHVFKSRNFVTFMSALNKLAEV